MTSSKAKNAAIVLGGAVALASGAYALGAQSSDGSAAAVTRTSQKAPATTMARPAFRRGGFGGGRPGWRGPRGDGGPGFFAPMLDNLAKKLGVSSAALRTALQQIRASEPRPMERRDDHFKAFADALGVSVTKLQSVLRAQRPERGAQRRDDLAAALAKQLGVDTSKVQAAFDKLRAQGRPKPGEKADRQQALADAIGVSLPKLQAAFKALRQGFRDDHAQEETARVDALAKALNLSTEKVKAALEKVRAAEQADHAKREKALAAALASKLNLDQAKVQAALDSLPHPGPGHP